MNSPEEETPQTERTFQQSQDSEHGFPLGGGETPQTERNVQQEEVFDKVRILTIGSPEGRLHRQEELI